MRRLLQSLAIALGACCAVGIGQNAPVPQAKSPAQCTLPADTALPLTREQGAEILAELAKIEDELGVLRGAGGRGTPINANQTLQVPIDPKWESLGDRRAPVAVLEYTDLQCPFCRAFAASTFPALKKDFVDMGKIWFITRDLPLAMHPFAEGAAEAARCAGAQGKFWAFRAAVLAETGPPTAEALERQATALGLDLGEYGACTSQHQFAAEVSADRAAAREAGIRGTPSFIIGRVRGSDAAGHPLLVGRLLSGNRSLAEFAAAIAAAEAGK